MALTDQSNWIVYLIRDDRNGLYCGITTDVARRFAEHKSGRGAKYFRGRKALAIVWQQQAYDRSAASRLEARVKKLTKSQKELLVRTGGKVALDA